MSHNVGAHIFLGVLLFIASTVIFDGGGLYSAVLLTTADVSGTLLSTGTDFEQDAARMEQFIPIMAAVIINIVIYYVAAGILIFIFGRFKKK